MLQLNKLHKKVKLVELEWGEAILSPSFDFIVLSDCFYDRCASCTRVQIAEKDTIPVQVGTVRKP